MKLLFFRTINLEAFLRQLDSFKPETISVVEKESYREKWQGVNEFELIYYPNNQPYSAVSCPADFLENLKGKKFDRVIFFASKQSLPQFMPLYRLAKKISRDIVILDQDSNPLDVNQVFEPEFSFRDSILWLRVLLRFVASHLRYLIKKPRCFFHYFRFILKVAGNSTKFSGINLNKQRKKLLRVIHLPTSIAGNPRGLSSAEKRLGIQSETLYFYDSIYSYKGDYSFSLHGFSMENKIAVSLRILDEVIHNCDVVHFNSGKTLVDFGKYGSMDFSLFDLRFYPKRMRLIMTYNGCDARLFGETCKRYQVSACQKGHCDNEYCQSETRDSEVRKRIKKVSEHVDHIFAVNPDLLWELPSEKSSFIPYTVSEDIKGEPITELPNTITIVHSPTNRRTKGTDYIMKAVENLSENYDVNFVLVENLSNSEALEIYRKSHLVIDQVLFGWYGGFAVECMKMGKPVAAYIREKDLVFIPDEMSRDLRESIININKDNICDVLSRYLEKPELLIEKSKKSLYYADKWHDSKRIAEMIKPHYY